MKSNIPPEMEIWKVGPQRRSIGLPLIVLATGLALTVVYAAIHCPGSPTGLKIWIKPMPPCSQGVNTIPPGNGAQCYIFDAPPGVQLGLCDTDPPQPGHCEDGHGIIRGTKYWGKCVAQWQCDYFYSNGKKIPVGWEDKDTDWSKPYPIGCGGT